jgi:hypothetical protein
MSAAERPQPHSPHKTSQPHPCRQCGYTTFRRAHRRHCWERLLSLTGLYPVRCQRCDQRTYRFIRSSPPPIEAARKHPKYENS